MQKYAAIIILAIANLYVGLAGIYFLACFICNN